MNVKHRKEQDPTTPSRDFVKQVKDALEHLYDFPYLQHHALIANDRIAHVQDKTVGQQLRTELVAAIEALSPGPGVPFRAPHARLYNLLQLRYVEGLTIREAAHELGLSERQSYRDLRRGEESVAALLWARRSSTAPSSEQRASRLSSLQTEMARLEPRHRPINVSDLLRQATRAVERLAERHSVHLREEIPAERMTISTDPVLARQVLINLLSHAVQQARPGVLGVTLDVEDEGAFLRLHFTSEVGLNSISIADPAVVELTERLCWTIKQQDAADGSRSVVLEMLSKGPTVLVIDDNEGLVELLDRYLTGHACRVLAASSGAEGLQLSRQVQPDAIVLDVMMPGMDGWELLQRLRAHSQTATTPVIICSVFNDPELAYSLGASLFLPKPVKRTDVLAALRQLAVV